MLRILVPLLAVAWLLSSCDCTPDTQNFALIGYSDVPADETYTMQAEMPGSQDVPFIARIYYPSYDEDAIQAVIDEEDVNYENIQVAEKLHPIVVFGHGRYTLTEDNYLGMTNLMYHLASWGYICISVNFDVIEGLQWEYEAGIPHRGELFLHAAQYVIDLNGDGTSIFHDKIDVDKIALIGHSRGGGGAIYAVNENQNLSSPLPILALGTISPVDAFTDPVQVEVPHVSLYGTWDGDLESGPGIKIWNEGVRLADKVFAEIHGANHFHFTDDIDYMWEDEEISRDEHHEISQGLFNAFLDKHVRGNNRFDWPDYLTGSKKVNSVNYYMQYLSNEFLNIDDGSPLGTADANNLGGMNDGTSLASFDDKMLNNPIEHFYNQSEGLILNWDGSTNQLELNFPAQDVTSYSHLSFRVCQVHGNAAANPLDTRKNFSVIMGDNNNNTFSVQVKDYWEGLHYPDLVGSAIDPDYQYKCITRTYRIPLAKFTGVGMSGVNKVVVAFDQANEPGFTNVTGEIAIDEIEFSN